MLARVASGLVSWIQVIAVEIYSYTKTIIQCFVSVTRYFANQSHTVERNESCNQAQFIKKEWNSLGLSTVELKRYDVLLWYPKRPSKLSLIDKTGSVVYSSILIRKNVNALTDESRNMFPFSVHSASGVARGKLLYVNYGRENDFKYLEDRNISCTGKIVLLRYGKILEYTKVK